MTQQPRYSANDLTQARERLMQATQQREALENEQKKPTWRSKATHDTLRTQLSDAKTEEEAANAHVAHVMQHGGGIALAGETRQAREAEQARKRVEQQEQRSHEMEASEKSAMRDRFVANGGTSQQFEASWPGMWTRLVEQRTMEGKNELIDTLKQAGEYSM